MMLMFSRSLPSKRGGFSLVEVIITMAIISILTALVMVRYGAFNSTVLLKNQAYEIALDIRDAQVRAVSVRSDENEFREEYGVFLSMSENFTQGVTNQQYLFWQDNGPSTPARYNHGTDNVLQVLSLDDRFYIRDLYVNCTDPAYTSCTQTNQLSISFARPNFDANLVRGNGQPVETAHIIVAPVSDPDTIRAVYVTSTGLVTVQ